MSVKLRFVVLSALTVCSLLVLTLFTSLETRKVYTATSFAAVNTLPTYTEFFAIRKALAELNQLALFHVIVTDEKGMQALEAQLTLARQRLDDAFKRYTSTACSVDLHLR